MPHKWVWILGFLYSHQFFSICALKGPPKLHPKPPLMTAEEGDMVRLPCPISANPEPLFEWKKDGRPVDDTWPRYVLRRHLLRIKSAREQDTGQFTCTGVNGFGQETFTFSLLVYGENLPPLEIQKPAQLTDVSPRSSPIVARMGESLTLICKVDGVPLPKIVWRKDGFPLHKSGTKVHLKLQSTSDAGQYSCTATNPLSIASHNFSVLVEEKLHENPEVVQAANATVVEGANTTLHCLVRSALLPEIQWLKLLTPSEVAVLPASKRNRTLYRDGRTYRYLSTGGARLQHSNGTFMSKLFIGNAVPMDGGVYVCVGATERGYNYKEVHLDVLPGARQRSRSETESPEVEVNLWMMILLPIGVLVVIAVAALIIYKTFRSFPEKRCEPGPPNSSMVSDDPTLKTPLKASKQHKGGANLHPDLVYQDGSSYSTRLSNMGPVNGSLRYPDPYLYQDNYMDPNYSDPYLEPQEQHPQQHPQQHPTLKGYETRVNSDQSYARLTQSTQSSTSPLPPPPYVYQMPFSTTPTPPTPYSSNATQQLSYSTTPTPHSHSLSHHSIHQVNTQYSFPSPHSHRDTKYVVHYNL